jgi:hypothetical protein
MDVCAVAPLAVSAPPAALLGQPVLVLGQDARLDSRSAAGVEAAYPEGNGALAACMEALCAGSAPARSWQRWHACG